MARLTPEAHRLFATQHGVAGVDQLVAAGLSARQIKRLEADGSLISVLRGAYRTPSVELDELGRCAAVCSARAAVIVSGPTAGRMWEYRRIPRDRRIHVIGPPVSQPAIAPWVVTYRTAAIRDEDVIARGDGIRVTTRARTAFDLARHLAPADLRSVIEQAMHDGGYTAQDMLDVASEWLSPRRPWASTFVRLVEARLGRRRGGITSGGAVSATRSSVRAFAASSASSGSNSRRSAGPGSTSPCRGCAGRSRSTCIRHTRKRRAARLTADVTMPHRRSDGRSAGSVHMTTRTRSIGRSPPSSIGTTSSSRRAPSRSNGRVDSPVRRRCHERTDHPSVRSLIARSGSGQEVGEGGGEVDGVVGAAQFAGRVHRELRHADVDRGDPEPGRGDRTDRRTARHVVARHEHLPRHAGRVRTPAGTRRRGRRGGVPLVRVDLDRRTGVDDRAMARLVPLGIVRDAPRGRCPPTRRRTAASARRRSLSLPPRASTSRSITCSRNGPGRAGAARRADLLVIVEHDHGDVVGRRAGRRSAVAAAQHDTWLSRRPDASSDRSAPSSDAPCTSYSDSSHHVGALVEPGLVADPCGELADRRRARRPTRG